MSSRKQKRRFSWLSGSETKQVESKVLSYKPVYDNVSLGRVVSRRTESSVKTDSRFLCDLMFGKSFSQAPSWWSDAPALGILGQVLSQIGSEDQQLVGLSPGWAYGALEFLKPKFLVIETEAFSSGLWAGALSPGSEHLFEELFSLLEYARRNFISVILIDNGDLEIRSPRSFTLASELSRLRRAVPGELITIDPLDSWGYQPSPFMQWLYDYQAGELR